MNNIPTPWLAWPIRTQLDNRHFTRQELSRCGLHISQASNVRVILFVHGATMAQFLVHGDIYKEIVGQVDDLVIRCEYTMDGICLLLWLLEEMIPSYCFQNSIDQLINKLVLIPAATKINALHIFAYGLRNTALGSAVHATAIIICQSLSKNLNLGLSAGRLKQIVWDTPSYFPRLITDHPKNQLAPWAVFFWSKEKLP